MLALIRAERAPAVKNRLPNQRCRPLYRSNRRCNTMMDACAAQQTAVVVTYCLNKRPQSRTFPRAQKLFREFKAPGSAKIPRSAAIEPGARAKLVEMILAASCSTLPQTEGVPRCVQQDCSR